MGNKKLEQYKIEGADRSDYRAISYGGIKILFEIMFIVVFILLWINMTFDLQAGMASPRLLFFIGAVLSGGVATVWPLLMFLNGMGPIKWLRVYWKLNVIGYTESFCLNKDENRDPLEILISYIGGRGGYAPEKVIAVNIPLGGWFNRPRVVCDAYDITKKLGIKISTAGAWDEGCVNIIDRNKIEVPLRLEKAIELFENTWRCWPRIYFHELYGTISWKHFAGDMLSKIQELQKEKKKNDAFVSTLENQCKDFISHQKEFNVLISTLEEQHQALITHSEKEKELAITFMEDAVKALEKTKRFIESTEAKRIRLKLILGLLSIMSSDDPRRKGYEDILAAEAKKPAKKAG